VRGAGYGDAVPEVRQELARVGAILRLRRRGRYLVHAAGVVDPSGRAWLLAGDSGSGKSTLAYALARKGWRVLGDDGVLIECRGAALVARAWRAPLRVSQQLTAAFPEVGDRSRHPAPNDPRRRVAIAMQGATAAPVAAVLLLARGKTFAMSRASAVSALAAFIRQSPWVILGDDHARPHLALLQHAAEQRVFHLRHTAAELCTLDRLLLEAVS